MADSPNHICDREKCDSRAVQGPKTTCIKCGKICFLLCYGFEKCGLNGIKLKLRSEIYIALDPNSVCLTCVNCDSVFLCDYIDERMQTKSLSTPNRKPIQQKNAISKPIETPKILLNEHSQSNPLLSHLRTDISKIGKQLQTLIRTTDSSYAEIIALKDLSTETKSVVKSLNEKTSEQNTVLNNVCLNAEIVADKIKSNNLLNNTPRTTRLSDSEFPVLQNSKRKRQNETPPQSSFASIVQQTNKHQKSKQLNEEVKVAVKKRELISGNSSKPGLGKAVLFNTPSANKAQRPKFKSIYVSRIENTITANEISEYIKQNIPDVNVNDFNVRILVKKDQQIEKLSFVSFRVSCTPELHVKLFDSSFWPMHVQIGEFFDNPRPNRQELGDFISMQTTVNNGASSSTDLTIRTSLGLPENESKNSTVQLQVD